MSKAKKNRNQIVPLFIATLVLSASIFAYVNWLKKQKPVDESPSEVPNSVQIASPTKLPKPNLTGRLSLETALQNRRTRRDFTADALNLKQISQMLWSAQGVTADWGGRTAPSAKSVYPLTVYLAAYKVLDLNQGIYQYLPGDREALHEIQLIKSGDYRQALSQAIGQNAAQNSPAILLIAGNMEKMAKAFNNERNDNNVYLEAGHAAQNLYLQAESLQLGMVTIAGFDSSKARAVLGIPEGETIIYAIPFGVPKP